MCLVSRSPGIPLLFDWALLSHCWKFAMVGLQLLVQESLVLINYRCPVGL